MHMNIEEKLERVKDQLRDKKVLVAFSGGADSTFLASITKKVARESLAVTVDNGVMPSVCIQSAEKIAQKIGIEHILIRKNFLEKEAFQLNPPNRCYLCKVEIYSILQEILNDYNYDFIIDGTNISDFLEDRPGIMVNFEKNIKTPLVDVRFTATEIREILKNYGWDYNPSTTCFATRIPTGTQITTKIINRISYAENLISNLTGLKVVRVRDADGSALIQVNDPDKLIDKSLLYHLESELKAASFKRVMMDLGGYGDSKDDLILYKPCKDEKNKIMFENELPYKINIPQTCPELESLGKVKCSEEMGIAILEVDGRNVTIFEKGKIVARRVKNSEDAERLLFKLLPCIRRQI